MTFPCPHCGRSIDGHILTDTQMIDHEMALETATARKDTLEGMVENARKMVWSAQDQMVELRKYTGVIEDSLQRASGELGGR
jgi:hypothetical protein